MPTDTESLGGLGAAWLAILLDAAVKGTLLLAAAGLVAMAMRRASAAARQVVWLLALSALLGLPLASAVLPGWRVLPGWARIEMSAKPVETVAPDAIDSTIGRLGPLREADQAGSHTAPPAPREHAGESPAPSAPAVALEPGPPAAPAPAVPADTAAQTAGGKSWRGWLVPAAAAAWLAGALVCLLPLLLGRISLWRLAHRSRRTGGGSWAMLSQRAAQAVGLRRKVVLLRSDAEPMPMIWGVFRPKLLLPAEAETWPADRRWVVLLHELAHAKRRDCLAKLVGHLACAAYWFNPLCWVGFRRMQREAEAACDDLVLSAGHRPSDYARHILEIASGLKAGMLAAYSSIAMARKSRLEGRLLAILDERRNRGALTRWGAVLVALVLAAFAVPLACMQASGPDGETTDRPPAGAATTAPAAAARSSTLAICILPNAAAQGGRSAMISPDDVAKMTKQLAAEGPKPPEKMQQYWWGVLDSPQAPPPQAVLGEYRGRKCILLCGDRPGALAPWENPPFRYGIVKAEAAKGPAGGHVVRVDLDENGRQVLSFMTRAFEGLAMAYAVDGKVVAIETISEPLKDAAVLSGDFTQPQAQDLAGRLLEGMPAVKAIRMAIQNQKLEEVRALLDANPRLVEAAAKWPPDGSCPLHSAAASGNLEIALLLLDRGANVNAARGGDGQTPLHVAASNGREEMIRLLLARGAEISATTKEGFTPLHEAATHQRVAVAALLLDAGADVNAAGKAGITPLGVIALAEAYAPQAQREKVAPMAALLRQRGGKLGIIGSAVAGDLETVQGILRSSPEALGTRGMGWMTPLHAAALGGHATIAKALLEAGAPVNPPGVASPLTCAAGKGHLEVVKLLAEGGADVNATDADGGTPIIAAAYGGHTEVVTYLWNRGAKLADKEGRNALISAAKGAQANMVRMLLDMGMDPNSRSRQGRTALIELANFASMLPRKPGICETARLLLERGADVNARDDQKHTALTLVCWSPFSQGAIDADLVALLVEHGANVNSVGPAKFSPLHRAAEKDAAAVAKLLLDAGANVFAEDLYGRMPLEVAEQSRAPHAAEVLREAMAPKLSAMRQQICEALQSLLKGVQEGDIASVTAIAPGTPEYTEAAWKKWAQDQHQALAAAAGRKLAIGNVAIREGWAAAGVSDAQGRSDHQTIITLMQFPDGAWRPVRFRTLKTEGSQQDLHGTIRDARMLIGDFREAVFQKAGKLGEPPRNVSLGGGLPGKARRVEVTASGGTLRLHFGASYPQLEQTIEIGPDRILHWRQQMQALSVGRSGKWTGENGLSLEGRDSRAVFKREDRQVILEAVGDSVRVQSGGFSLTASRIVIDLPTLEATTSRGAPAASTRLPASLGRPAA